MILMLSLFLMTGCSKETKFKSVDRITTGFHKVNVAEKIDDGVLYFKGDKILYDKDGTVIKIADKVSSLWRENDDIYHWRVTMVGPRDTPYEGGLFTITVNFPQDYPTHGPEFKFKNKIYHLNVDFKNDFGHICINSLNEWRTTGKVSGKPGYAVKQALFDIFCLFYNQGIDSPYDDQMAMDYRDNPEKFNEIAKKWTKEFAPLC